MINKMKRMNTTQQVLKHIEGIQVIKEIELHKSLSGLNNDYIYFEKLETIAYKIAVKKATTIREVEMCAVAVEENYTGALKAYKFAEQIRIKAYGLEWYLMRQFNAPAYQGFIDIVDEMGINNLFKGLQGELS